jgi:hypothetical protein
LIRAKLMFGSIFMFPSKEKPQLTAGAKNLVIAQLKRLSRRKVRGFRTNR